MEAKKKVKFFLKGWLMILMVFILAVVTLAFPIYHFSVLRVPIIETLGATSGEVGLAYSCFALALAFTSLIIGNVLERFGLRKSLMISSVVLAAGFAMIAYVDSLPMLFLSYIVLGIGDAFAGVIIFTGIPANWFVKYRGLANGIVMASTFVGSLFVTNFIAFITIESTWQNSLILIAVVSFVVVFASSFVLKWHPSEVGLFPDGITEEEAAQEIEQAGTAKVVGLKRSQAAKTPTFWMFIVAIFLIGVGEMGPFQNLAGFIVSLGNPLTVAAMFLSLIGLISVFAKLVCGVLIDRFSARFAFLVMEILASAGLVMFMFATPESSIVYIYAAVLLFGFGESAAFTCFTASAGKFFGVKHYAAVFSLIFVAKAAGDAVGSPLIGAIAESPLGWFGAFGVSAATALLAAVIFWFTKKDKNLIKMEEAAALEFAEEIGADGYTADAGTAAEKAAELLTA